MTTKTQIEQQIIEINFQLLKLWLLSSVERFRKTGLTKSDNIFLKQAPSLAEQLANNLVQREDRASVALDFEKDGDRIRITIGNDLIARVPKPLKLPDDSLERPNKRFDIFQAGSSKFFAFLRQSFEGIGGHESSIESKIPATYSPAFAWDLNNLGLFFHLTQTVGRDAIATAGLEENILSIEIDSEVGNARALIQEQKDLAAEIRRCFPPAIAELVLRRLEAAFANTRASLSAEPVPAAAAPGTQAEGLSVGG